MKKRINLNKFARSVTLSEGKKISMSIGQIKECVRYTLIEMNKYDDNEILTTIHRYKKYI